MKSDKSIALTGLITALSASWCCILPVVALFSGVTGIASSLNWMEPIRPFFIGATVILLGFAWFRKLKPVKTHCECPSNQKTPFMQTKTFLGIITAAAFLMLSFPNYASLFFTQPTGQTAPIKQSQPQSQTVAFKIRGMTCDGCTLQVANEINKVAGILNLTVSYSQANALVTFDQSKTNIKTIEKAIRNTGYQITETKSK